MSMMEADRKGKVSRIWVLKVLLVPLWVVLYVSGASADGNVTMESLTIYRTHEWFGLKPTVYFRCGQENKVYLPDIVHKDQEYLFFGQESWQPLTTLYGEKCKRCGLYEADKVKADDTFYEAELCPKDFAMSPEGRLVLFVEKEFNATLLCPDCIPQSSVSAASSPNSEEEEEPGEGKEVGTAIIIIVVVLVILIALGVTAYSKWRQKLRRDQQARFVKLFEDDDDLDAELGLKDDL